MVEADIEAAKLENTLIDIDGHGDAGRPGNLTGAPARRRSQRKEAESRLKSVNGVLEGLAAQALAALEDERPWPAGGHQPARARVEPSGGCAAGQGQRLQES
jgi:hypothetical protein